MPWTKTAGDRQRDAKIYGDPEYQRNRKIILRQAGGRCQQCGTRGRPVQADHITPVTRGGGHDLANLQVLCSGPGSCHAAKTAAEGRGYRPDTPDPEPAPRTTW